jgi:hypothetical protein
MVCSISSNHHGEIANTLKIAFLEPQQLNNQPIASKQFGTDKEEYN